MGTEGFRMSDHDNPPRDRKRWGELTRKQKATRIGVGVGTLAVAGVLAWNIPGWKQNRQVAADKQQAIKYDAYVLNKVAPANAPVIEAPVVRDRGCDSPADFWADNERTCILATETVFKINGNDPTAAETRLAKGVIAKGYNESVPIVPYPPGVLNKAPNPNSSVFNIQPDLNYPNANSYPTQLSVVVETPKDFLKGHPQFAIQVDQNDPNVLVGIYETATTYFHQDEQKGDVDDRNR